jgi:acylphosphatase
VSGALVSLKQGTSSTVELAASDSIDRLLGVAGKNSLIELNSSDGTVEVVTAGEASALVSDINGKIKVGDKITASPIAGVGMKALTSTFVIGTAQDDLANVKQDSRTVTDVNGKQKTVNIGAIPIQVDKVFYESPKDHNSFVPPVLQDFANNVAGKPVSPIRVIIATFLIAFIFATVIVLIYSSIKSSIISIGRNPLSGGAVNRSLIQVGITVFGLMAFTAIVVYIILST